jgi:hypothetical protein
LFCPLRKKREKKSFKKKKTEPRTSNQEHAITSHIHHITSNQSHITITFSRRYERVQAHVLVQQVARVFLPERRVPLRHEGRHPHGVARLHGDEAVSQAVDALALCVGFGGVCWVGFLGVWGGGLEEGLASVFCFPSLGEKRRNKKDKTKNDKQKDENKQNHDSLPAG